MNTDRYTTYEGGCHCGTVRFRVENVTAQFRIVPFDGVNWAENVHNHHRETPSPCAWGGKVR